MPNAINFKEWDKKVWEKANKKNKKISIGWAGASGHKHDLELLKKAVKEIKSKYKNVEFVLFGDSGNKEWFNYDRQIDWTPIFKYPESYAKAGCDIMIAPMRDSKYNRGKSSLRILEAGSLSIPVVASPVGDYVNFPVLYAKTRWDWTKQLEKLIENKSLRRKLGNKLYRKIKKDHNIKIEAKKLYKELAKLKDKRWKSKYNWKKKLEK